MSHRDLEALLRESQRIFDLAILIRATDDNPAHGAALVHKALVLLSRVIAEAFRDPSDTADAAVARAHGANQKFNLVELDIESAVATVRRISDSLLEGVDALTPQDRAEYERLLSTGPRMYLQVARQLELRQRVARSVPRALSWVVFGLLAVSGAGALAFRLLPRQPLVERPGLAWTAPPQPSSSLPPPLVATLPGTVEEDAFQAAAGPIGQEIRIDGAGGTYRAVAEARGTRCLDLGFASSGKPWEGFPAIEMRLDGKEVWVLLVDSEDNRTYSSRPFTVGPGPHVIQFFFNNDFLQEGRCDRNAWLRRVTFEPAP